MNTRNGQESMQCNGLEEIFRNNWNTPTRPDMCELHW